MKVAGAGGDSSWLLANVDARGFYQVNYDETNWGLLAAQLQSNHKVCIHINHFVNPFSPIGDL